MRGTCSRKAKPWKKVAARRMRNNPTESESAMWRMLKGRERGAKFRRQVVVLGFIADFYCASARIVIEVDGSSHTSKTLYDLDRDAAFRRIGIETVRFTDRQVLDHPDKVIGKIRSVLTRRFQEKRATA